MEVPWASKPTSTSSTAKIRLGRQDAAYKKARDRDDSIKREVTKEFKDVGYPIVADFIQGSLKTNTGIVPISGDYDIDRALVIDADTAPENPVTPKKKALEVLENRGFKNAKIKKPCVTADYASDNVHIDLIIYKRSGDQLYLAVGKKNSDENNREWAIADPLGLMDWIVDFSDCDDDEAKDVRDQFYRLVRYVKRWRDVQFSETVGAKVFSIGLTVMVKQSWSRRSAPRAPPRIWRHCVRLWKRSSTLATSMKRRTGSTVSALICQSSRTGTSSTARGSTRGRNSTTSSTA